MSARTEEGLRNLGDAGPTPETLAPVLEGLLLVQYGISRPGETTLSVAAVDTVVDGTYVGIPAYERVEVDGRDTDVWRPGETLVLEDADTVVGFDGTPARVRVVTGSGVADASEVVEG